ncbi:MAG: response regulator transcription factor [Pseudorhodoplanes sp.]|jgi:FixJ family two-component response regulator|nr:response regulator transcription factor [Pseudorhodoplanes sp.]
MNKQKPNNAGEQQEIPPTIYIVDDDDAFRDSLVGLFRSVGLQARSFRSAKDFLEDKQADCSGCLVLDVRLPGVSGLDFQAELEKTGIHLPIVFITGHGDIPMSVKAMKAGAIEFLTKPVREQDLLDAVQTAVERSRIQRQHQKHLEDLKKKFSELTIREQEVFRLVAAGLMNKQIAAELGVSEITVKIHRGNMIRKMGAKSLADLVRKADLLNLGGSYPLTAKTTL